jgi:hypothetical protein
VGVAIAVIGIHQQRNVAGAGDAADQLGEFGQRQHHDVGRAQNRQRGDGARQDGAGESEFGGNARRDRVKDRGRMGAALARQQLAERRSALCGIHCRLSPPKVAHHAVVDTAGQQPV